MTLDKFFGETETEVKVGSTVKFENGYYRVTKLTKAGTVNLGSIFGGTIYHKKISISEVVESHDEWYKKWSQSESYMSM